jgi:lysophospholipase L1-like esterase
MKKSSRKASSRRANTSRRSATSGSADALRRGRRDARALLERRHELQARRQRASRRRMKAGMRVADAGGALLLAEGDSWFDYPFADVLGDLQDMFHYEIESVAHRGDTVEDMAYNVDQHTPLVRKLESLKAQGRPPKALLLSGGGNDVAGPELGVMLNHKASGLPSVNESVMKGVFDERLRLALLKLIGTVTELYRFHFNRQPPIVIHGYAYPVPDGRGYAGGWGPLPGPWLEPSFRRKGFGILEESTQVMKVLLDRFNAMAKGIAGGPGLEHVTYLDLRGVLSNRLDGKAYQKWWANELHPTRPGFEAVATKFHETIQKL